MVYPFGHVGKGVDAVRTF